MAFDNDDDGGNGDDDDDDEKEAKDVAMMAPGKWKTV